MPTEEEQKKFDDEHPKYWLIHRERSEDEKKAGYWYDRYTWLSNMYENGEDIPNLEEDMEEAKAMAEEYSSRLNKDNPYYRGRTDRASLYGWGEL